MKKATEGIDSDVVTQPCQSSRYPTKCINDQDFANNIPLLQSSIPRGQEQLTRNLDFIISVPKTEFMKRIHFH